jgi:hypothetical protein
MPEKALPGFFYLACGFLAAETRIIGSAARAGPSVRCSSCARSPVMSGAGFGSCTGSGSRSSRAPSELLRRRRCTAGCRRRSRMSWRRRGCCMTRRRRRCGSYGRRRRRRPYVPRRRWRRRRHSGRNDSEKRSQIRSPVMTRRRRRWRRRCCRGINRSNARLQDNRNLCRGRERKHRKTCCGCKDCGGDSKACHGSSFKEVFLPFIVGGRAFL